jgi:thioredoxin 1
MASTQIVMLNEESFKEAISKGKTLVDFYADWCGPCRMLAPVLETVASDQEVSKQASVAKIDIDSAQGIASNYNVTSIPTLILFQDGKELRRLVGLRDANAIKHFIISE